MADLSQMNRFSNIDFDKVLAFLSYALNSAIRQDPESFPAEIDESDVIFTVEGPIWAEEFNGWIQSFTSSVPSEALDDTIHVRAILMDVDIHNEQAREDVYPDADDENDFVRSLGNTPMEFEMVNT